MAASPIYTTSAMRKLEALAAAASPAPTLMERAGAAAAEYARALCGDKTKDVLVAAGPGNNGGDAFEVAAQLKRAEEHTSELQSHHDLVCRLLLEKKHKETYWLGFKKSKDIATNTGAYFSLK